MRIPAIVLSNGMYETPNGKTAHGLVRGSERFEVLAVVDARTAGRDAGQALDGVRRDIPVVATLEDALSITQGRARVAIIGVATHGGKLTADLRAQLLAAARAGLGIVNGLHEYASEDPAIAAAAKAAGIEIIDVRKPKPKSELHYWTGAIARVKAPRIAVLGMDCAIGKRTTARMLVMALNQSGVKAEMIYTGQTGWMQGGRFGLVLDSVVNDFVSGELEHAILTCERESAPDVMIVEGQSALRNPSGPCGAELLVSTQAHGAILQHAPGRRYFDGCEEMGFEIPPIASEIALIGMYGARVLAVTLNGDRLDATALARAQRDLARELSLPVVQPLAEGVASLVPIVRRHLEEQRR
jgi:uncharacterized NAD-dependent epimerase/dehydratase family protein